MGDTTRNLVVVVAVHQEQVGRGQHGNRDPRIGQHPRGLAQLLRRQQREFRDMADGHAPAPAEFVRLAADILGIQRADLVGEVEMHIDVHVELARHLENPVDLSMRV